MSGYLLLNNKLLLSNFTLFSVDLFSFYIVKSANTNALFQFLPEIITNI